MAMGWDDAAVAAVALLGKLFGGGEKTSSSAAVSGLSPELQSLLTKSLRSQAARADYTDPLFMNTVDAVNGLLPRQFRTHGANQPIQDARSQTMSPAPEPIDPDKTEWMRRY